VGLLKLNKIFHSGRDKKATDTDRMAYAEYCISVYRK